MLFYGMIGGRMVMDDCFQRGKICLGVLCKLPPNDATALTMGTVLSITQHGLSRVFCLSHEIEERREREEKARSH